MRLSACLAALWAASCAHAPPPVKRAEPEPAGCAAASVVVLRDVATAVAVDPVETQREVMLSDAFRAAMAKTAPQAVPQVKLAVARKGRSAVLRLKTTSSSPDAALAACSAALDASFAFGKEALEFLQQHAQALEADRAAKLSALREFEIANDLLSLPIKERLAGARERVREIGRVLEDPKRHDACKPKDDSCRQFLDSTLQASLEKARADARRFSDLEAEWDRRARDAQEIEKRLELLRTKLGDATLAGILQQDLRVLDLCGPCRKPAPTAAAAPAKGPSKGP